MPELLDRSYPLVTTVGQQKIVVLGGHNSQRQEALFIDADTLEIDFRLMPKFAIPFLCINNLHGVSHRGSIYAIVDRIEDADYTEPVLLEITNSFEHRKLFKFDLNKRWS